MLPPGLQSPREVTLYYDSLYYDLIDSGKARPFLYPWSGLGAFLVLGYLLLDHRQSRILQWLRLPVYGALVVFQAWCVATQKAKHPAAAFGVGLLSAWGVLWVGAIMVFNDCQRDFTRLERGPEASITAQQKDTANAPNGTSPPNCKTPAPRFHQQAYPSTLAQRLDWVADVFCSFRGVGWNWQFPSIPPAPKSIETTLHPSIDSTPTPTHTRSKTGIRRFSSRTALTRHASLSIALGYLALDLIKTLMHHDAYFWGYGATALPPSYLPPTFQHSPVALKSYRLLLSLAGIYTALHTIFALGPLFFAGLLGPRTLGLRGEPWMNPADMFGSFRLVAQSGLAGWWGGWWHQTFRFAFEAPTTRLLEALGLAKRSQYGRLVAVGMAFGLSGCLHACGSYTQMGATRPLRGPMCFFLLQGVGVVGEMVVKEGLRRVGVGRVVPAWVRGLVNVVWVFVWLYFTAPLLVDDFAKGGVWLFEPVAVSPLRTLGLGAKDDTWNCWWNGIVWWRSGEHWWDTGIAL